MAQDTAQATASDWFAVNRQLIKSDFWLSEPFTKAQAWIDLLALARYKDGNAYKRSIEIPLERGQLCWSVVNLAARWSWSRDKVKRFLSALETKQQISQQKTNVTTVITIVNYNHYQPSESPNKTANESPNKSAEKHQTSQQTDTKEESNKDNKEKKGKTPRALIAFAQGLVDCDERKQLIGEWLEYKIEIKKPMKTERGLKVMVNEWGKYTDEQMRQLMDHAMSNGYQGLVWDKVNANQKLTAKDLF